MLCMHHFDTSAKQGDNYEVHIVKLKGAVTTIGVTPDSKHFAIGTEKGFVSSVCSVSCLGYKFISSFLK